LALLRIKWIKLKLENRDKVNSVHFILLLCGIRKKPTAQTAHLVFAQTQATAEKTKRAIFCQRTDRMNEI